MTKFNPERKAILTIGEVMDSAVKITDQHDADQYLAAYVDYIVSINNIGKHDALVVAKSNISYCAGYFSNPRQIRALFKVHEF